MDDPYWKKYAFKYADGTTKYVGLTNGAKFKIWERVNLNKDILRVDLDFRAILNHKREISLTNTEKQQILFIDKLSKRVLWDHNKYHQFDDFYGQIDIAETNVFSRLLDRLDYVVNRILMQYTLEIFERYYSGYNEYSKKYDKIEESIRNRLKERKQIERYEQSKRELESSYKEPP